MQIRRIVTGHDRSGKSVFVSDNTPSRVAPFEHVPGLFAALVWQTAPGARLPIMLDDPTVASQSWVPAPGGSNVMVIVFPPDNVMANPDFNPTAAGAEYLEKLPGLAEKFEIDAPGMHTTNSIDYAIVLEGEVHLELDDGQIKRLGRHDIVIQNGTRHAWRNKGTQPATMLFVLVGTPPAVRTG
jgi:Cupin domain